MSDKLTAPERAALVAEAARMALDALSRKADEAVSSESTRNLSFLVRRALASLPQAVEDEDERAPGCEGCGREATHYDTMGVPLCEDCYASMIADNDDEVGEAMEADPLASKDHGTAKACAPASSPALPVMPLKTHLNDGADLCLGHHVERLHSDALALHSALVASQAECERLRAQIDGLARGILTLDCGEPSRSEGACETALRMIHALREQLAEANARAEENARIRAEALRPYREATNAARLAAWDAEWRAQEAGRVDAVWTLERDHDQWDGERRFIDGDSYIERGRLLAGRDRVKLAVRVMKEEE